MTGWALDDIPWLRFDAGAVDADLLAVVKTAALVEANAADYVAYLSGVFAGDAAFLTAIARWGVEEQQHGAALGRWAEAADPTFDFARALADFRAGYRIPQGVSQSIRGSRAGELVARQVVETGTSSFYSAIRDATAEPVLAWIAGRIAADEFAHYRLFQIHFARYHAAGQGGWQCDQPEGRNRTGRSSPEVGCDLDQIAVGVAAIHGFDWAKCAGFADRTVYDRDPAIVQMVDHILAAHRGHEA